MSTGENPFVKIFMTIGIILASVICLVLIINLIITTTASGTITKLIKEQLKSHSMKLPFNFEKIAVNPLMGEVSLSGITVSPANSAGIKMQCSKIALDVNHAELLSFIRNPEEGVLKTARVKIEQPEIAQPGKDLQISCRNLFMDFNGSINKAAMEMLGSGNINALISADQSLKITAEDIDIKAADWLNDPAAPDVLQNAFDIKKAEITVAFDKDTKNLQVKSSKLRSPAWEGDFNIALDLNTKDIMQSRISKGKITMDINDKRLKEWLQHWSSAPAESMKEERGPVILNVTGTMANPVIR